MRLTRDIGVIEPRWGVCVDIVLNKDGTHYEVPVEFPPGAKLVHSQEEVDAFWREFAAPPTKEDSRE